MLDIGMSELINFNVDYMNIERSSFNVSNMTRTPMSDTQCDNKLMHAAIIFFLGPSHQECNSSDVSGVARKISQIEGGRNRTSLNVGNDIIGEYTKQSGQGPHYAREVGSLKSMGEVLSYVTLHQMSLKT